MKPAIQHSALTGSIGCANFLGRDFTMICVCCAEEGLWRTDHLVRRLGADQRVADFSRTFVCPGCDGIGTSVLRITPRPAELRATRFRRMAPPRIPTAATQAAWAMRGVDPDMALAG